MKMRAEEIRRQQDVAREQKKKKKAEDFKKIQLDNERKRRALKDIEEGKNKQGKQYDVSCGKGLNLLFP